MSQTLSVSTLLAVPLLPLAGAVLAFALIGHFWRAACVYLVRHDTQKRGDGRRSVQ